jgi:outer membrane protein assembly factor BamD
LAGPGARMANPRCACAGRRSPDRIMTLSKSNTRARIRRRLRTALFAVVLVGLLAGCAGKDKADTLIESLNEAYDKAKEAVDRKNYRRGIQIFEAIQARYPFSDISRQVQLDLMYAYYKGGQREQAVEAADTFIRENPIHPRVDYALYIKGLSYFEDEAGFLERRFKKDVTMRPPKDVDLAYSTFRRLVDRYPASEYAPDAEQRLVFLKNRMAAYQNHIADYYLRRGAYVAALNRAKTAIEEYNGSPSNAESLKIMASAYENLGMQDLAADTRRVLALNFPNRR